jgi:hypothetical protein
VSRVWKRRLVACILLGETAVVGVWTVLLVQTWFGWDRWDHGSPTVGVWLWSATWTLLSLGIPLVAAAVLWVASDRHPNYRLRVTSGRALVAMKFWQLLAIPLTVRLAVDLVY